MPVLVGNNDLTVTNNNKKNDDDDNNNNNNTTATTQQHDSRRKLLLKKKAKVISSILNQKDVDLWKLRAMAISDGGLVNDSIRRRAWPKLVGLHEKLWEDTSKNYIKPGEKRVTFQIDDVNASSPIPSKKSKRQNNNYNNNNNNESTIIKGTPEYEAKKARDMFHTEVMKKKPIITTTNGKPPRFRRDSNNSLASSITNNDDNTSVSSTNSLRDKVLAQSLDYIQIELDVTRCTWHLLTGTQRLQRIQMEHKRHKKMAKLIRRKQRRLANLINITLVQSYKRYSGAMTKTSSNNNNNNNSRDNTLRYYQGYHDVACIVLSTLSGSSPVRLRPSIANNLSSLHGVAAATGLDMPSAVLLQISQSHFRDCMRANFQQLQTTIQLSLFPLIAYFDPEVHEFLKLCDMEPYFALSWVLTWYSHEIRDTELAKRLFDFFIVSHPLMPIYVAVAMICHPLNRQEVLQTECDFSLVHQVLTGLPRNSSMVGWKYRPGDGYVSDDEEDLDDDSSVGMMDSQSSVDTDFLLYEEAMKSITGRGTLQEDELAAEAVSTVSSSVSSMFEARVPFQELITNAIEYMEKMPPRNLLNLSSRYYGRHKVQSMIIEAAPCITFFEPPPDWIRAEKAKSDRVLQHEFKLQQQQQLQQNQNSSSPDSNISSGSYNNDCLISTEMKLTSDSELEKLLTGDRGIAMAAIAAGFGPGDDAERQRRAQQMKQIMMAGAVIVVAVAVGYYHLRNQTKNSNNQLIGTGGAITSDHQHHHTAESPTVLATSSFKPAELDPNILPSVSTSSVERKSTMAVQPKDASPIDNSPVVDTVKSKDNDVNLMVHSFTHFDLLFAVLAKTMMRESMLLGEKIGDMGKAIMATPFKAIAKRYKTYFPLRRKKQPLKTDKERDDERTSLDNEDHEEMTSEDLDENDYEPEKENVIGLILAKGIDQGVFHLKGTIDAALAPLVRRITKSTIFGTMDDVQRSNVKQDIFNDEESEATILTDESNEDGDDELDKSDIYESQTDIHELVTLDQTRLRLLEEEFDITNVSRFPKVVAQQVHRFVGDLTDDLRRVHKLHLAKLAEFNRRQVSVLSALARLHKDENESNRIQNVAFKPSQPRTIKSMSESSKS